MQRLVQFYIYWNYDSFMFHVSCMLLFSIVFTDHSRESAWIPIITEILNITHASVKQRFNNSRKDWFFRILAFFNRNGHILDQTESSMSRLFTERDGEKGGNPVSSVGSICLNHFSNAIICHIPCFCSQHSVEP